MHAEVDPLIWGLSRDWWSVLNILGTLLAALGTASAVIVSLCLARRSARFRGTLSVNIVAVIHPPIDIEARCIAIKLVNTSQRNVKVTGIGWRVIPWPDKSLLHQLIDPVDHLPQGTLPVVLMPGDDQTWYVDIQDGEWFMHVCDDWKRRPRNIYVWAALSDGTMFERKVGKGILRWFQDGWHKAHPS